MTWLWIALGVQAIWGVCDVMDKVLRQKHLRDTWPLAMGIGIFALPTALGIGLFRGFSIDGWSTLLLVATGVLGPAAFAFYFRALGDHDASRVVPLFQLVPVWTAGLGLVFLSETIPGLAWVAFGLVLAGGIVVSIDLDGGFRLSGALWLMAICTGLLATGYVVQRAIFLQTGADPWDVAKWSTLGYAIGGALFFVVPSVRRRIVSAVQGLSSAGWRLWLADQLGLTTLARLGTTFALAAGPAALVSVLAGFQGAFVLIYALLFARFWPDILDEDVRGRALAFKVAAVLLMLAGVGILAIAGDGGVGAGGEAAFSWGRVAGS